MQLKYGMSLSTADDAGDFYMSTAGVLKIWYDLVIRLWRTRPDKSWNSIRSLNSRSSLHVEGRLVSVVPKLVCGCLLPSRGRRHLPHRPRPPAHRPRQCRRLHEHFSLAFSSILCTNIIHLSAPHEAIHTHPNQWLTSPRKNTDSGRRSFPSAFE